VAKVFIITQDDIDSLTDKLNLEHMSANNVMNMDGDKIIGLFSF